MRQNPKGTGLKLAVQSSQEWKKKSILKRRCAKENVWCVRGGALLSSCETLATSLQLSLLEKSLIQPAEGKIPGFVLPLCSVNFIGLGLALECT